jgi:hypothetical protein
LVVPIVLVSGARATCGDYLQMAGDHVSSEHAPSRSGESQPANIPCGCRGAACGSTPFAPPAPKAPSASHSQQDVNLLEFADGSLAQHPSWTRLDFSARPCSGYPLLLNRPPSALV